ncbi:hypothetical protein B0H63DRAFT_63153 [Podospora didyma]|uniref:Uncharacterized protein n=1 Tax=Podospora didyma TaxID=330526 RepID=A0AAE0U8K2_9PEZI|nr:hypothetical protein B0H63DRAFT_63153 [Podospora didyma]
MYKSAAIRDTQLSLKFNESLWRLSWVTFVFLPLTFVSGFFGMNVDLFTDNPSIGWYFLAAVVLLITVLGGVMIFRKASLIKAGRARKKSEAHMV